MTIEAGMLIRLVAATQGPTQVRDGRVVDDNLHSHRLLHIDQPQEIRIDLVPSAGVPSGLGEAAVKGSAPALGNALFAAAGARLPRLPIAEALKTSYILPI
ncbi:MAG: hypothetical protein RIE74_14845 [Pseudomonadales bacterium]